jgi:hypothetical protein
MSNPGVKQHLRSGSAGWAAIAAVVILWDGLMPESLTAAFAKARDQHPAADAAVVATWTLLTLHLFGALPRQADPFMLLRATFKLRSARNLEVRNARSRARSPLEDDLGLSCDCPWWAKLLGACL